jgi:hypothetical protein
MSFYTLLLPIELVLDPLRLPRWCSTRCSSVAPWETRKAASVRRISREGGAGLGGRQRSRARCGGWLGWGRRVLVGRRAWGAVHGGWLRARRMAARACAVRLLAGERRYRWVAGGGFSERLQRIRPDRVFPFLDVRWSLRYIARAMSRHVHTINKSSTGKDRGNQNLIIQHRKSLRFLVFL